jgi:hypothetical protein
MSSATERPASVSGPRRVRYLLGCGVSQLVFGFTPR